MEEYGRYNLWEYFSSVVFVHFGNSWQVSIEQGVVCSNLEGKKP